MFLWIATPCRARLAMTEKQKTPQIQTRRRILGFCDDFLKKPAAATPCTAVAGFGGFQGAGAGILLGVNEQARAVESTKTSEAQFL